MKHIPLFLLATSALLFAGCTSLDSLSGDSYSRDQARRVQSIQYATIMEISEVTLEGTDGSSGSLGGGLIGGAVGSNVGGGNGRLVGAAVGAVAGAVIGSKAEHSMTTRKALEITVQLENGQVMAITQERGNDVFAIGQKVKVMSDGVTTRVRPAAY